jgi:predicted TIM-barrel fold metal-dependent hydrolase
LTERRKFDCRARLRRFRVNERFGQAGAAAPARCVWGTDWPHPNATFMPNDGDLVDLLANGVPDEALRHRVLVENPAQLYSF